MEQGKVCCSLGQGWNESAIAELLATADRSGYDDDAPQRRIPRRQPVRDILADLDVAPVELYLK